MGDGSFDLSHKTLSNNDEKKISIFVSDYLNMGGVLFKRGSFGIYGTAGTRKKVHFKKTRH